MKLTDLIRIYKGMFPVKNSINILYTGSHKSFPMYYGLTEQSFLKLILAYLCCTKYNEINK